MAILKSPAAERTPSGPSLCSRAGVGQQGGQFVAAGGSGLQHRPIDVALDGAYRQSQSLGNFAAGQSLTDQHHDLAFPIGHWQGIAGLTKRRSTGTALFGQSGGACRATQRRSPKALLSIRQGGMGGRIDGSNKIARTLEFFRHRGQLGGAAVAQGLGEPRGHANTGPLDDPLDLTQPTCARTVPELGGGLQRSICVGGQISVRAGLPVPDHHRRRTHRDDAGRP
jgi:hypothetical protein